MWLTNVKPAQQKMLFRKYPLSLENLKKPDEILPKTFLGSSPKVTAESKLYRGRAARD
jgi:hypothetical protein